MSTVDFDCSFTQHIFDALNPRDYDDLPSVKFNQRWHYLASDSVDSALPQHYPAHGVTNVSTGVSQFKEYFTIFYQPL